MRSDRLGDPALDLRPRRRGLGVAQGHRCAEDLPGIEHWLPSGAPTHVGEQGIGCLGTVIVGNLLGPQTLETADDARCAETTLAATSRRKRLAPGGADIGRQTLDGRDLTAPHTADGGHARDARLTVDEDGAASALTLWRTPVLDRHHACAPPQDVEQGRRGVGDDHGLPINGDLNALLRRTGHEPRR